MVTSMKFEAKMLGLDTREMMDQLERLPVYSFDIHFFKQLQKSMHFKRYDLLMFKLHYLGRIPFLMLGEKAQL